MRPVFLEQWLHDIIRRAAQAEPEFYQSPGRKDLSTVSRADVDRFRLFQLQKTLAYTYENSSFYRERFDKSGVKPEQIKTLADLSRIPLTNQADLAENNRRFVCGSLSRISTIFTFATSSTLAPAHEAFLTDGDIERLIDFMGAGMRTVAHAGEVVQVILPFGSENDQGELLSQGLERIGASPVRAGVNLTSEEQLQLFKQHKPSVLFGTSRTIYRLSRELQDKHILDKLGVRSIFVCTSGYLSPARRSQIESIWNCEVYTHYGMPELGLGMAIECSAHDGYHFDEAALLIEIVEPKTRKVIEDDREGELVFTTLNREGMPLIRYRTGNISRLITEPCTCGAANLMRFAPVQQRLGTVVRVGDEAIYPGLFDEPLHSIPQVIDYQVTVNRTDGKDNLGFTVEVAESGKGLEEKLMKALLALPLIHHLMSGNKITRPALELVPTGTLRHNGHARPTVVDRRPSP